MPAAAKNPNAGPDFRKILLLEASARSSLGLTPLPSRLEITRPASSLTAWPACLGVSGTDLGTELLRICRNAVAWRQQGHWPSTSSPASRSSSRSQQCTSTGEAGQRVPRWVWRPRFINRCIHVRQAGLRPTRPWAPRRRRPLRRQEFATVHLEVGGGPVPGPAPAPGLAHHRAA